jgi:hypothetical protein
LFQISEEYFGGRRFKSSEQVLDVIKQWINGLTAKVYHKGVQKLVTRYDKCFNVGGEHVEI